jgi:mono/diheme cytochrome c family protein
MSEKLFPPVSRKLTGAVVKALAGLVPATLFASLAANDAHAQPTYSEHIAPILHQNCASCHRPGEAAPFSLLTFDDARRRAKTINRVVGERFMPPWKPVPGHGDFQGERRLSEEQIALIDAWVTAGAPEGDPSLAPEPPEFVVGWQLGEPDLVLEMEEAAEIPAEGRDIYRYFALPMNLKEDKWVRAIEVRPSARSVVHHALFFLDTSGRAVKMQNEDTKAPGFNGRGFNRGKSLGGWAVGGMPLELDDDYALPMPKGSDFVLQTHFHPSGKKESEKTRIGIYFAGKAPEKRLLEFQVPPNFGSRAGLLIEGGDSDYTLKDHLIVPEDLDLVTVWGHAHQICTDMQATATLPDGKKIPLFKIDDWDFDWQGQYAYKEPVHLPKGTRIDTEIHYDNSDANPNNPNHPPHLIRWGEQSFDEMGSLIFQCVSTEKSKEAALATGLQRESRESAVRFAEPRRDMMRVAIVMALDKNKDDRLTLAETPEQHRRAFTMLDRNKDDVVEIEEVKKFGGFLDRLIKR